MAVYTEVDDEALADFLLRYDIGEAIAFKGIAEGVENSNYLLETTKARFILTLYEKRVNADDLPFFMGVMEALADAGFPAPLPVKANVRRPRVPRALLPLHGACRHGVGVPTVV